MREIFKKRKLTKKDVKEIKKLHREGMLQKDIVKKFPVGRSAISSVIQGKTWKGVR